jgi:UDP-N-acetylglucosamine 2-epimerase (non-hydrolysing)
MQKKKVLIVFGTRPEAIKMAPLVIEFKRRSDHFDTVVCVTAQHREMLDQVLALFNIRPDHDLNIMRSGQDLYDVTSRVMLGMRSVLNKTKPNLILVHGDTTTSTAAALSAFYQQIPVGHVEAGLRTNNIYSPWPEEMNRQLTSRLASYHFSPTEQSKKNLLKEGIESSKVFITGNTVIDALHWVLKKSDNTYKLKEKVLAIIRNEGIGIDTYNDWLVKNRKLVLVTGHRRENFGQGFLNICNAIKELSVIFPEIDFVYPMHLNPNVRNSIKTVFGQLNENENIVRKENSNVYFLEPLDYLPFIHLMNASHLILTDSGGIQEEAPSLGKPVLVMRETTERPEALKSGTVKLVGTDKQKIINEMSRLIQDEKYYKKISMAVNPYGDGRAAEYIVNIIRKEFF